MEHGALLMDETAEHIPFDQYQRYWVCARVASLLKKIKPVLSVLDIGGYLGYPGSPIQQNFLPIKYFFPGDTAITIDRKIFQGRHYIQGDARALPVKNDSFDIVTLLDTIEHVPQNGREHAIREALRVAAQLLIISCPMGTQETALAEKLLASFLDTHLDFSNSALQEHIENKLPTPAEIEKILSQETCGYYCFSYGNLYRWLEMMFIKHLLIIRQDKNEFHRLLDVYHNTFFNGNDAGPPFYRSYYVVFKNPSLDILNDLKKSFPEPVIPQGNPDANFSSFLRNLTFVLNTDYMQMLRQSITDKDKTISELQNQILLTGQHVKNLESFQANVQQTIVYRLYKSIKNFFE